MTWTFDIEFVLEQIRSNSMTMSNMHKKRYTEFKSILKHFRIPTLILSINVFASVGLQPYMEKGFISFNNLWNKSHNWSNYQYRIVCGRPIIHGSGAII